MNTKKTLINIQEGNEVHSYMYEIDTGINLVVKKTLLKSTPLELFRKQTELHSEVTQMKISMGISEEEVDGKRIIKLSDEHKDLYRFFSPHSPCWFDGCEELRKKYNEELELIGGNKCKTCDKGALIRKYLTILKNEADPKKG